MCSQDRHFQVICYIVQALCKQNYRDYQPPRSTLSFPSIINYDLELEHLTKPVHKKYRSQLMKFYYDNSRQIFRKIAPSIALGRKLKPAIDMVVVPHFRVDQNSTGRVISINDHDEWAWWAWWWMPLSRTTLASRLRGNSVLSAEDKTVKPLLRLSE